MKESHARRDVLQATRGDSTRPFALERLRSFLPLGALIVLAGALRFGFLGQQSFWFDEALTVRLAHKSLGGMLAMLPDNESTPPLYYVLAWAWSRVFGTTEVGLRALSALLGTVTVPVAYAAGRFLVSRRAGLFTAALVACSPLLVWYSQEARSYALLVFLSALSLLAFSHALLRSTPLAFFSWALVACLALMTHYFAVFLIGAQAVWLLLACRRARAAWAAVGVTAAAGVALLPLALHQQRVPTGWIAARPLRGRIKGMLHQFVTGEYSPPHHAAVIAALLALGVAVGGLVAFTEGRERRGGVIAFSLGGVAVLAPLALAATHLDRFFYRNLIGAWVPLAIGLATACASQRARRVGLILVLAACAGELASAIMIFHRTGLQRDDWRSATKALGSNERQRAIITEPFYERVPIELYLPEVRAMPPAGAGVREIVFLGISRLPLDFRPPAGFERIEQQKIQHIALVRYRSARPRAVTPAALAARGGFSTGGVLLERPNQD